MEAADFVHSPADFQERVERSKEVAQEGRQNEFLAKKKIDRQFARKDKKASWTKVAPRRKQEESGERLPPRDTAGRI